MPSVFPARALLVFTGLVLIVGTAAGATALVEVGTPAAVVASDNTTAHLQPETNNTVRRSFVHADVDVGVAVADNVASMRASHASLAFERAVATANNRSMQLREVRAALSHLENRTATVERTQRQARADFRDRSLTASALSRHLARLHARAEALEIFRGRVEDVAATLNPRPETAITNAQNLESALETVGGPATSRVRERYAGNRSAGATYVSVAGSDGLVVATAAQDTFYREALDENERRIGGTDTFADGDEPEISVALRRASILYPWAFANGDAAQPLRGYGNTTVYRITIEHTHGRLSTYLDGVTGNVFKEIHGIRGTSVPINRQQTVTGNGLRLRLNSTYDTGPMGLTVVRETTGSPVDATVTIDETLIGRTGEDGHLWTVQPMTETTITAATGDNTTVSATVGA